MHARDLGGGELLVRTAEADVVVRGTRFSVSRAGESTRVELEEERVAIVTGGRERVRVRAGQAVRIASGEVMRDEIGAADAAGPDAPSASGAVRASRRGPGPAPSAGELAARAARLEAAGDVAGARRLYRRAGAMSGYDAQAALLALARLELRQGRHDDARAALAAHRRRFGATALSVEALALAVRVARARGSRDEARRIAGELIERYPGTPQAEQARRWLEGEER